MMKLPFFPIIDGSYGGNQAWFTHPREQGDGCGVVAAANLYFYYKDRKQVTKHHFLSVAEDFYKELRPLHFYNPFSKVNSYGLPFFSLTMKRIGKKLQRPVQIYRGKNEVLAKAFIKKNILRAQPVILLIIMNKNIGHFSNHYVTITSFREDEEFILGFSSWGTYYERPLRVLLEGSLFFRLGAFYE